jgi:ABC-type multidrug transport system fused ATPase/permease subunit
LKAISTVLRLIPSDLMIKFIGVVFLATIVGLMEMLGVASIMPFVAMLTDPASFQRALESSPVGSFLPSSMGLPPVHTLGIVVLVLFFATNILSLIALWASIRFSAVLGVRMSRDLAESYYLQGYLFLQNKGSAVLANDITRETEKLTACSVLQVFILISKLIQVLLIIILLAAVSPELMLAFSGVALTLYFALYMVMRKRVSLAGNESMSAVAETSRRALELFAASKEILISGNKGFFIGKVESASKQFFSSDAVSRLAPVVPKYLIELLAFTALLSAPIYRSLVGQEYKSIVPTITLFAYAGYRLLPAIQQLYSSYSLIKFYDPLAHSVVSGIQAGRKQIRDFEKISIEYLKSALAFNNVKCVYPDQEKAALENFSIKIERGDRLAVIGPSGAGKSTLIDVLLGLLPISEGSVVIDNALVDGGVIPWMPGAIGYVPQTPLMISASIAENIAFGVPLNEVNLVKCEAVAQIACIDEVIKRLPDGYRTILGEGISLSGGECQRIAIARALYGGRSILIMDEPCSALDPLLSSRIIQNLCAISDDRVLIVVSHDWDLLHYFSKIAVISEGKVVSVGNSEEVSGFIAELREKIN